MRESDRNRVKGEEMERKGQQMIEGEEREREEGWEKGREMRGRGK